ncbi:ferritin [Gimesia aquarii]|uniref:Ferritin n=1 Tax=Gimesia aquarii TaxID=2527964 RepID=A0A517WX08_9PLAN|nr:ferritin [Gimesia aquarii]QDU09803.1 putative ferritin-1 [Gimesia aquarii]
MYPNDEKVFQRLNEQIHLELDAWYGYLAMSTWCSKNYFPGFAKWLNSQAQEEYTHAMKLRWFLIDRGKSVILKQIEKPKIEFTTVIDIFEAALDQEKENTRSINSILQFAFEEKAYATSAELQWFITEQVEEERSAQMNLAHIKMVADDPAALLDLDKAFGEREAIFPVPAE